MAGRGPQPKDPRDPVRRNRTALNGIAIPTYQSAAGSATAITQ
jgi:hypothetical protein